MATFSAGFTEHCSDPNFIAPLPNDKGARDHEDHTDPSAPLCPLQPSRAGGREAAIRLGIEHRMEKITDVMRFADFGVMLTPALVVDGEVKASGRVPSHEELKQMLG
jgi:hypothetical protein